MIQYEAFKAFLAEYSGEKALIFPHISPDGDTIGSAIGIQHLLKTQGIEGVIILNDDIPSNLTFITEKLPTGSLVSAGNVPDNYRFVIAVDCGEPKLFADRAALITSGMPLINIDHHFTNESYGDLNIVEIDASSTGELICKMIESWEMPLNALSAEALYAAIVTDTGSFRYSNTRPYTFEVCCRLMSYAFDFNALNVALFQNKPFEKLNLLNRIFETLKRFEKGRVAFVKLDDTLKRELAYDDYDTDGVVEYVRDIEGVEVVIFLKTTTDGGIKGSLRAKNNFDVSAIAKHFGGGGHVKAAGFTTSLPMAELEALIVERVCKQMEASNT
ncbi:bifunctional oligoribonuclease/PAP phosphatase NrnA [Fusibacter paucivorans]|uniref:Bifunctional oligoribonuclease/PAP phosphatase NrnA n=1 Tax=Fusibacter paucivorans TaxID=76009 RepID=A0ABS5PUG1_9FIRM|nr:bifunctional oligoribonuclease/PAP phosphatase NrnA [Fusibacter paucivorans]MBS7528006.1 bifunctional oligoribonuclease/PAP phosphatase NrnA [Fusibacter paucivorans]